MEIINDNQEQAQTTTTPENNPQPAGGCLQVGVKVVMGIIGVFSALTFIGCVIGATITPVAINAAGLNSLGLETIDGAMYIATFACVLCAIPAAFVAYICFCVAFGKRIRGWIVITLIALFVGSAIGGCAYGVNSGVSFYSIADEIELLEDRLDRLDDGDIEGMVEAILSVPGKRTLSFEIEEVEDFVVLDALNLNDETQQQIKAIVLMGDEEVDVRLEQDVASDGSGIRKITIRMPNEDINIIETLPKAIEQITPTE